MHSQISILVIIISSVSFTTVAKAQSEGEAMTITHPKSGLICTIQNGDTVVIVDEMPQFQGGSSALYKYLSKNVVYPKQAKDKGTTGTVYVSFVVSETGQISNVKPLNLVDPWLEKEAVRVVTNMPNWEPGYQKETPIKVNYILPIKFSMQNKVKSAPSTK